MPTPTRHVRRPLLGTAAALLCLLCLLARAQPAGADEVGSLARTLRTARAEKTRLAAAVAMGRLRDHRAIVPLLRALHDSSPLVRAVAATALGQIGDADVLPSLRDMAADGDHSVRKRAGEAIQLIEQRTPGLRRAAAEAPPEPLAPRFKMAAHEQPRLADNLPPLHVAIKSVTNRSGAQASVALRKRRADRMRSVMMAELAATPEVVLDGERGTVADADHFSIDGTITRFHRRLRGDNVEVLCEIQILGLQQRGQDAVLRQRRRLRAGAGADLRGQVRAGDAPRGPRERGARRAPQPHRLPQRRAREVDRSDHQEDQRQGGADHRQHAGRGQIGPGRAQAAGRRGGARRDLAGAGAARRLLGGHRHRRRRRLGTGRLAVQRGQPREAGCRSQQRGQMEKARRAADAGAPWGAVRSMTSCSTHQGGGLFQRIAAARCSSAGSTRARSAARTAGAGVYQR